MSTTVIVVEKTEPRFNGFLASCMLEAACGVYVAAEMSARVRDRVWQVLEEWHASYPDGRIVMAYRDKSSPSRLGTRLLGCSPKIIVDMDGMLVMLKLRINDSAATGCNDIVNDATDNKPCFVEKHGVD